MNSIKSDLDLEYEINVQTINAAEELKVVNFVQAQRTIISFLQLLTSSLRLEKDNEKPKQVISETIENCISIIASESSFHLENDLKPLIS